VRYSGTSDTPVTCIEGFGHHWREYFLVHVRESLPLETRNTRIALKARETTVFARAQLAEPRRTLAVMLANRDSRFSPGALQEVHTE
jgi:hypothetical protein